MAPGRQPLSNMCPVLGRRGRQCFALGASGGRRILPAVLQVTLFLLDHGLDLEAAFQKPRLDVSGPDLVTADARLAIALPPLPGAASRRLAPQVSPLLFACATGVLDDTPRGWREGMTEPLHPWADAVGES